MKFIELETTNQMSRVDVVETLLHIYICRYVNFHVLCSQYTSLELVLALTLSILHT